MVHIICILQPVENNYDVNTIAKLNSYAMKLRWMNKPNMRVANFERFTLSSKKQVCENLIKNEQLAKWQHNGKPCYFYAYTW